MPLFEHIAKFASIKDKPLERKGLPVRIRTPIHPPSYNPLDDSYRGNSIHDDSSHSGYYHGFGDSIGSAVKITNKLFNSVEESRHRDDTSVEDLELSLQEKAEKERLKNKQRHRRKFKETGDDIESGASPMKSPRSQKSEKQRREWLRQQTQLEAVVDASVQPGVFISPASRRMQEARQQRWRKKPREEENSQGQADTSTELPNNQGEAQFEEKKLGRNMRAVPKSSLSEREAHVIQAPQPDQDMITQLNTQHQLHRDMMANRAKAALKDHQPSLPQNAWGLEDKTDESQKRPRTSSHSTRSSRKHELSSDKPRSVGDMDIDERCHKLGQSSDKPRSEGDMDLDGSHGKGSHGDTTSHRRKKKKRKVLKERSSASDKDIQMEVTSVSEEFKKLQPSD